MTVAIFLIFVEFDTSDVNKDVNVDAKAWTNFFVPSRSPQGKDQGLTSLTQLRSRSFRALGIRS